MSVAAWIGLLYLNQHSVKQLAAKMGCFKCLTNLLTATPAVVAR